MGPYLLIVGSVLTSFLLGEGILRLIVDPVDYLSPYLVADPVLGIRIEPHSAGHDAWGFRNRAVPARADIVAIGDSQTYGVSVRANDAWPAQLERMIAKKVYNLALGGYSPVQYHHLLGEKALKLNPSRVIVGLYYGNDLVGAYTSVNQVQMLIKQKTSKRVGRRVKDWLAHHSIFYRMATYSLDGAGFFRKNDSDNQDIAVLENGSVHAGFTPMKRWQGLNLEDFKVREGLQICLDRLRAMQGLCRERGVKFSVLLIPTKECVFADYIYRNRNLKRSEVIDRVIEHEQEADRIVKEYLTKNGIHYVEVLKALRSAVRNGKIYPSSDDGHPLPEGHRIIASALEQDGRWDTSK